MVGQMLHEMHGEVLTFNINLMNIDLFMCLILSIYMKLYFYVEICHNLSILCYLKFSWYSKGLNFTNEIIFFNHEFVYLMVLKFLDVTDMLNKQKIF